MAPIAGMTDGPYRKIVMNHGAGMVVSELISANALVRDSRRTFDMLPTDDEPKPISAQIFGGDPEILRDSAVIIEETPCDYIDLNFGCPVKKVVKTGAGSAMLQDLKKAGQAVEAVVRAVKKPVTVKFRTGWTFATINAIEAAKLFEEKGAHAITLHGRTASQGYSGTADWDLISEVANAVKIPVIGNGDITTPEIAIKRLNESACSAIMIGRGALGNPWIFEQVNELLETGTYTKPAANEIAGVILSHIRLMASHYGEKTGIRKMRTHMGYYSRGVAGGARFREKVNNTRTCAEMERLVTDFFDDHQYAVSA
ncbi:tRNA-dihydrouridine synthase DusB [hydrothermal vent metagenome]|uniref:tRNA-dihydrouridine synthase DusB n=1 Tax=hydrothermal vent metagenome TaxID=652676 RepID=A0A3B1BT64_9ZZZZ